MAPGTRLPSNPARCTFLHDCSRMSPGLICTRSILKHAPFTDGVRRRSKPKLIVCQSLPQQVLSRCAASAAALACSALLSVYGAQARLEGVNKPELLPNSYTPVIDVAGFLTPGEESRIRKEVESLEEDTGVKLRVLAQNYPTTPGLAVKEYWKVDDDTVVFVADPSLGGNILNFNVGSNIDLRIPRNFWTRLGSKYGTKFYWQERGEGNAIVNAVSAIDTCAREPISKLQCTKIQGEFGEEASAGPVEKMFLGG